MKPSGQGGRILLLMQREPKGTHVCMGNARAISKTVMGDRTTLPEFDLTWKGKRRPEVLLRGDLWGPEAE